MSFIRNQQEQAQSLRAYMPSGRLFNGDNFKNWMLGLAGELIRATELIETYSQEIIPDNTVLLIDEWESALGIPDDCFPGTGAVAERRLHVLVKLASLGVQTAQDFIDLAALFGITVTVARAWVIDTVSYDSVSFSVAGQDTLSAGIFFKPDGMKMYMVGTANDTVYQYTLSTAWDLSTASYDSVSFDVSGQDIAPREVFFKPDGTKMYMVGNTNNTVYQYTLSTAWDLSTASYDSVSFSVAGQDSAPTGIFFKSDGTKMYVVGSGGDNVYQYTLSTAWDISTASYDSVSFKVSGQDINPTGIFFKSDGTKMYVVGSGGDNVYQYTVTGGPFNIRIGFTISINATFPMTFPIQFGDPIVGILECLYTKLKPANCDLTFVQQ